MKVPKFRVAILESVYNTVIDVYNIILYMLHLKLTIAIQCQATCSYKSIFLQVLSNPEAAKYVSGIGVHWYTDFLVPVSILTDTHHMFPDRFILATEACNGNMPWELQKVILGSWRRAEKYAHSITEVCGLHNSLQFIFK